MKAARGPAPLSLHLEIPSRLEEVDRVCREIRSLLRDHGLEEACFSAELLARESLNNAIVHGHRRDERKKVKFDLRAGRRWISLRVLDEGPGFDWRKARKTPPPKATAPSGRGLCISALYAQRIRFNRQGNRITLWLKK